MVTAMQDLKEDLELAIDSTNDALNDIIDETTRSRCKMVVKITIGDILKRINNELLEIERQQTCIFGAKCCVKVLEKKDWSLEELYNETFNTK